MQGAYIQLVDENGGWDKAAWHALFNSFRKLKVNKLIIQWSVYDQKAFYRSQRYATVDAVPLDTILELADAAGIRVMVGLTHDSGYWEHIQKQDKHSYLMERLRKNMAAAAELHPQLSRHKSFAGWYISEEIDDLNWRQPEAKEALFSYLQQLSAYLRIISRPQTKIGLSGFANNQTSPFDIEMFWIDLLTRVSALDRVYFQDGIGVGKLDLNNLGVYFQAIGNATKATGRAFTPVIEVFEQTAGAPISDGDFAAVPTRWPTLLRQMEIAREYSAEQVAFGIPEYMTPAAGESAGALYHAYLNAMRASPTMCGKRKFNTGWRAGAPRVR